MYVVESSRKACGESKQRNDTNFARKSKATTTTGGHEIRASTMPLLELFRPTKAKARAASLLLSWSRGGRRFRESARFRVAWCAVVGQSRAFPEKVKRHQKDRRNEDLAASSILVLLVDSKTADDGRQGVVGQTWQKASKLAVDNGTIVVVDAR